MLRTPAIRRHHLRRPGNPPAARKAPRPQHQPTASSPPQPARPLPASEQPPRFRPGDASATPMSISASDSKNSPSSPAWRSAADVTGATSTSRRIASIPRAACRAAGPARPPRPIASAACEKASTTSRSCAPPISGATESRTSPPPNACALCTSAYPTRPTGSVPPSAASPAATLPHVIVRRHVAQTWPGTTASPARPAPAPHDRDATAPWA